MTMINSVKFGYLKVMNSISLIGIFIFIRGFSVFGQDSTKWVIDFKLTVKLYENGDTAEICSSFGEGAYLLSNFDEEGILTKTMQFVDNECLSRTMFFPDGTESVSYQKKSKDESSTISYYESGYVRQEQQFSRDGNSRAELYENGDTSDCSRTYYYDGTKNPKRFISYSFYQSGQLKHNLEEQKNYKGKTVKFSHYGFNIQGDTVFIETKTNGDRNGEYRISHYDYQGDSVGNKIYEHYLIRTIWSNDSILDFINTNLVYLNAKYRIISEEEMIELLNRDKIKWKGTFVPQEIWQKNGDQLRFIIHPIDNTEKDKVRLETAFENLTGKFISRSFNRLIRYSESITFSLIDTVKIDSVINQSTLSKKDAKELLKLLDSESKYDLALIDIPLSQIKITSHNGTHQQTNLRISTTGEVFIEHIPHRSYIRLKPSKKLSKKLMKLISKYLIFDKNKM